MPVTENDRIIREFLILIHHASTTPDSTIFPAEAWQTLEQLKATLTAGQDDISAIANAIANWCKFHQYGTILRVLRPVRNDPIDDDEDPDIDRTQIQALTNLSVKVVTESIAQAQEKRESS